MPSGIGPSSYLSLDLMISFILRRLATSIPILLAATLLVFWLVTLSGDPLEQLRQSNSPDAPQRMATMAANLGLDKPFFSRYFAWLSGVFPFEFRAHPLFIRWSGFDFGRTREGQDVSVLLRQALTTSLRLVLLATVLAVALGLVIGIISAVRQYSAIDYASTFIAFLCFSLPVFWLAVLLKEFGAIKLNNFLEEPGFSIAAIVLLTIATSLLVATLAGGSWLRRVVAGLVAAASSGGLLWLADATDWLTNPGIADGILVLLAAGIGALGAAAFAPLSNRRVLLAGVVAAVLAAVGSLLLSDWVADPTWWQLVVLFVLSVGIGAAVGAFAGEIDRPDAMKAGALSAVFVGLLVGFDQFISAWSPGRTIGTIGPQTPNLDGPFWYRMVDYFGHQILPSLALMLIGFATFMRFTRASMLDTLKSDYVRTARAKGLPATQVILRHAFRTALIPVVTVATISFATVIEGAVITETVFGWQGTGQLFVKALRDTDPYPMLGFLVVVAIAIIVLNAIADILYAVLDPRIRR